MGTLFGERDAQMIYSTLCAGRGTGSILSGPVSQALLNIKVPHSLRRFGDGRFAGVVLFVGSSMAGSAVLGGLAVVALSIRKDRPEDPGVSHTA